MMNPKKMVGLVLVLLFLLGFASAPSTFLSVVSAFSGNATQAGPQIRACGPGTPCPIGITDYGINRGSLYSYSALSFYSETLFNSLDIGKATQFSGSMGVQLNAEDFDVAERNTVFSTIPFWTQDVMQITQTAPGTFSLRLLDNVWFDWGNSNVKLGTDYFPDLLHRCSSFSFNGGKFYFCFGPTISGITLPFRVDLEMITGTLTSGSHAGDSAVEFGFKILHGSHVVRSEFYDLFAFDSKVKGNPHYVVDYRLSDPQVSVIHSDVENVLGGEGGGASVHINSISAAMLLDVEPLGSNKFVPVPHAFSAGSETGETAVGVNAVGAAGHTADFNSGTDSDHQLF